jgi:hypothetical protein
MCLGCFVSLGGRPARAPLRRAPATASAEGAQFNVPPFPATAWAEGPQLNAAPFPAPILRRLSSTSHSRARPCSAWLGAAAAGQPQRAGGAARAGGTTWPPAGGTREGPAPSWTFPIRKFIIGVSVSVFAPFITR